MRLKAMMLITSREIDWNLHLALSFSKTSVFLCPRGSKRNSVKKIYSLKTVFKMLRFRLPKNTVYVWTEAIFGEKKAPFSKISGYVWTGPDFFANGQFPPPRRMIMKQWPV